MTRDNSPFVIAIVGGSGSGKTTLARKIARAIGEAKTLILSQDSYYLDQSQKFDGDGGSVNFDHPSSIDFKLMKTHLELLRDGQSVDVPIYDFASHTRKRECQRVSPKPLVLVDGTLLLTQPELRPLFDEAIFLNVPETIRFERRLKRDVAERGREPEGVRRQFERQVAPMHDQFVEPSSIRASQIIVWGADIDSFVASLNLAPRL